MNLPLFLTVLPILLLSVVVHEVAHALVAKWEGDDTAYKMGRVTLNPFPHLDRVGSLIVPALLILLPGDFIFGWAKPVPVNPRNFRDPVWGDIRVSLAGIVSNLLLAILFMLVLAGLQWLASSTGGGRVISALFQAAYFGLFINLILAVFNLIPIPPLDGSHVVYHLLPEGLRTPYRELGKYGIGLIMLVVLVAPGGISLLLRPVTLLLDLAVSFVGAW